MSAQTILVLSPTLASQIAAGEVVERPASVVKELVENAVDAGATRCDVTIEAGGIGRILVTDDGRGMSEADVPLSVTRHATSKLRSFDDLNAIESFGFRGEALASIASVSRLRLATRARDTEVGFRLTTEGGSAPKLVPEGLPVGTEVEVSDLFYNVPARRKFLRSSATESGHITEVLELAALSRPELTLTLTRDGRKVREWLRSRSRQERTEQVLNETLAPCRGERGPLSVEAYLSSPERARQGTGGLRVFVNRRPVRQRALASTIAHAYGSVLERGRYPRGVVYLDLPLRLVDVNVHPQKSEVRFADPRAVSDALHSIVSRALAGAFALPASERSAWASSSSALAAAGSGAVTEATASVPVPAGLDTDARVAGGSEREQAVPVPFVAEAAAHAPGVRGETLLRVSDAHKPKVGPVASPEETAHWSKLRFLSQVRQTYLICEAEDGLCIIDQHAAAERVVFSKLRHQFLANDVASQTLLFPVTIDVHPDEMDLFERYADEIQRMGLEARARSGGVISIHAVPRLLQKGSPERMLRDLLSELGRSESRAFSGAVDKVLATMACHAAIRAGDPLRADEASALLQALDGADFAGYCPHGRPIVAFTSWAELERKVGRR